MTKLALFKTKQQQDLIVWSTKKNGQRKWMLVSFPSQTKLDGFTRYEGVKGFANEYLQLKK